MIYDQLSNASFSKKIESVQHNAVLAITGTIKGSSREKIYQELGLEYLYRRRWVIRLCLLCKVFQLFSHPLFIIIYHQWAVHVDMLIRLIWFVANLNISRTLSFLISLMGQRLISKKRCFEKYRSCFSFMWYTLTELVRKPNNWRQIYKHNSNDASKTCWKEKIIRRHNKVAKWLVNYFSKIRKQPHEVFFSEYCIILEAPILKYIYEPLLLQLCSWNWEKLKIIYIESELVIKNRLFQHQYQKQVKMY